MKVIKLNYLLDPYKTFLNVNNEYAILLDSCIQVKDAGDNSFIFFNPKFIIVYKDQRTYLSEGGIEKEINKPVLEFMDEYMKNSKPMNSGLVFDGGFAGYLSYDFGMEIMEINKKNEPYYRIPEVYMGYYEDYIIIDHKNLCTYIHSEDEDVLNKICNLKESIDISLVNEKLELFSNFRRNEFEEAVEKIRSYIKIGDVYQVNISQQFRGMGKLNASDLYEKFRRANYGPYNAFLQMGSFSILSTSPEQFIRKRSDELMTRPIKGTIRKSEGKAENELLKEELLNSEKNRSELLMIIDLERNDLARLCIPGSVRVEALFDMEEYATVNHLVSTIKGNVKESTTFGNIIKAMFPGGSITGAPKLRAMEIIEELENVSRGIYTGSIGYVSNNGNMDFNIAIRTAIINDEGVFYNVGGGITWDSQPEDEFEETLDKGKAIYKVLTGGNR